MAENDRPGTPDGPSFVPSPPPYVDEAFPATGRRSGLIEQQRRDNGSLPDEGDVVVDKQPFRPKGGR